MRQKTVFEGWFDQHPGWEFDMPAYMVKPILGYVEVGSGSAGIERLVEEYLISRFMTLDETGKAAGTDEEFMCPLEERAAHSVRVQFGIAKKGRARPGVWYWRRVVEWDDEDQYHYNVLEGMRFNCEHMEAEAS